MDRLDIEGIVKRKQGGEEKRMKDKGKIKLA